MDRPHSRMMEWGEKEKKGRPKRKRRERAKPLEVELDLGGEFPRGNMLRSSLDGDAHIVSTNDFKHQEDL